jgi:hypothetical protein
MNLLVYSNMAHYNDCTEQTVKFPVSQMILDCIASKGVGRLESVSGTVNAERYINILGECLKPVTRDNFQQTRNCIFQQDCASRHMANRVSMTLD